MTWNNSGFSGFFFFFPNQKYLLRMGQKAQWANHVLACSSLNQFLTHPPSKRTHEQTNPDCQHKAFTNRTDNSQHKWPQIAEMQDA